MRRALTGTDDPRRALQENGGLADLWFVDEGDIHCHPILVPSCLMIPTTKLESSKIRRNQKSSATSQTWTQLHPGAFAGLCLYSGRWKQHGRSRCGTLAAHRGPTLGRCTVPGPADRICFFFRESLGVSRVNHILRVHTRSCKRNELMRLGRGPLRGSSRGSRRTVRSKRHSAQAGHRAQEGAGHRRSCTSRCTHCSQTANLGYDSRCSHSQTSPETTFGDPP